MITPRTTADSLLAGARNEVLVMTRLPGAMRRVDHLNLRRGVRYRVLLSHAARTDLGVLALAGADARTVPSVPSDVLVVDGALALLPSGSGVAVLRLRGVVATAVELFERVWPTGVPLESGCPAELCTRERELLSLLCTGSTDESAAARLGVSVRTVRRMVAVLMDRLGARSRFQAGVRAADRGWLMEQAG
ncbi:helix-turn-helix transcriptional regulator [Lentzea tibetensis]|uniref:Helix-turn-helix transcriptional regulator n=1 Tax=Lentzea tibetensis TaxID=2591470 RepID=A0A563EKJ0_9PSEU|nr:helix-turn-helix transcriptional regulator [Lentzea tibetensis]TWP47569.1 helix-turn-helix transcriptional regulator [Lentzea tibetensis]